MKRKIVGEHSWPRTVLAGAAVLVVLLAAPAAAGCGTGGLETTTTTTLTPGPGPGEQSATPASSVPTGPSDTTPATVEVTTTTTGIVTTIPNVSSTTTTEALSSAEKRLANGHIKAMGFIDKVYVKDGKRYISIDYAEMWNEEQALAAGVIEPGEHLDNDYYISNVNPKKRTFEVSATVAITTSTRWVGGETMVMGAPCTWKDFKSFWGPASSLEQHETNLHASPWWIERDGQIVVKIDEQYLP